MSFLLFLTCGIWLIGLGLYFALLRPTLLLEDLRYIGISDAQIQSALPGCPLDHTAAGTLMWGTNSRTRPNASSVRAIDVAASDSIPLSARIASIVSGTTIAWL